MKAAVYQGIDNIEVKEIPVPEINDYQVLMKVEACAVCGSDIRIFHHGNNRVNPPQILGHEMAGQVVKAGKHVDWLKEGDRIAVGADVPCGKCVYCQSGIGNNCLENYAMGYQFAGGFAQYCLLNEMVLNYGPVHLIPDHVSYDQAALAEPLACVINGLELVKINLNDTVVVIGAGPIGCMMVPMAKLGGATKVVVVDKDKNRVEQAKKFGADYCVWADYFPGRNKVQCHFVLPWRGTMGPHKGHFFVMN